MGMEQNDTSQRSDTQRLWIGGLNPPSLTVEMVQERIKQSLGDKFDLLSFDGNVSKDDSKSKTLWGEDSRTYFFITAKSKISMDGEEESKPSPLELIAKQYNRVKWKGCVLQVEKAKLHFLQRLELEREEAEAMRAKKEMEMKKKVDDKCDVAPLPKTSTKRHLRIRKQHGTEAYIVDTKPIETNDWKDSMFTIKKQRSKYQKHEDKLVEFRKRKNTRQRNNNSQRENDESRKQNENYSLQSKSFLNRAVRLNIPSSLGHEYNHAEDQMEELETNVEDQNDSSSLEESKEIKASTLQNEIRESNELIINEDTSSEELDSATEESEPESMKGKNVSGQYEWSDSDDDSDGDNSNREKKGMPNTFTRHNHNAFDEFESAFIDQPAKIDDVNDMNKNHPEEMDSLEDDVISNLKLLTHLYPDMKVRSRRENTSVHEPSTQTKVRPGWNASSLMQRYDPNAQIDIIDEIERSSKPDEDGSLEAIDSSDEDISSEDSKSAAEETVNDEEAKDTECNEGRNSVEGGIGLSESKISSDTNEDATTGNLDDNKNYIYEQKKLENIFQQERSGKGTTTFALSSLFSLGQDDGKGSKAISQTNEDTKNESTFKFSFGTPGKSDEDENKNSNDIVHEEPLVDTNINRFHLDKELSISTPTELTERNSFFYSSIDLDASQDKFFKLNGGVDFVLNLQQHGGKREADKEQWQVERKTLTLDWKRKQKYALSKRKRMKFR